MSAVVDYNEIWTPPEFFSCREQCPVCEMRGASQPERDRYGFTVYPATCICCGLRWFSIRMSATEYAKFYQTGTYRRLVSAYHGREMGGNEKQYARHVAAFVRGYGIQTRLCSILDIGGAPDGLWGWWERCTIAQRERIIDPAIDGETAETFDARGETWDLILVAQTVDHLLEPGAVFKKLAGCLAPAGILFFDAVDWDATKEYKIDHPCNFNMRSASMLAEVAGLRIDKMERSGNHLRFLCRHW